MGGRGGMVNLDSGPAAIMARKKRITPAKRPSLQASCGAFGGNKRHLGCSTRQGQQRPWPVLGDAPAESGDPELSRLTSGHKAPPPGNASEKRRGNF